MPEQFADLLKWIRDNQPGIVGRIFEWFVGPPGAPVVDAVCRVESLAEDMWKILDHLGYNVSKEQIQEVPAQWVTSQIENNAGKNLVPDWGSAKLVEEFLSSEVPAIKRFYRPIADVFRP